MEESKTQDGIHQEETERKGSGEGGHTDPEERGLKSFEEVTFARQIRVVSVLTTVYIM